MNGRNARDGWVGLGVGVLQGGSLGVDLATAADLEGMTRAPLQRGLQCDGRGEEGLPGRGRGWN